MKLVMIESPYASNVAANVAYALRCALDCHARGEASFASHLYYTQFLDDNVPEMRRAGIEAGLAWAAKADLVAFYLDLGWSPGMKAAYEVMKDNDIPVSFRYLDKEEQKDA